MRVYGFLGSLMATAVLLGPVSVQAAPRPGEPVKVKAEVRVYDSSHKDYHVWDEHEDQAYRQYLGEQHMKYRVYGKQNQKQQAAYWEWRHSH